MYEKAGNDDRWIKEMNEEIHAIEKNNTQQLTILLKGKKPIGVKQIYKTKYKPNEEMEGFKVQLVTKEYKQNPGIDDFEVFTPVTKLDNETYII